MHRLTPISLRPRLRAFTLVEMLVVVAIIAVLISLVMPMVQSSLDRSRVSACTSNLRQIAAGMAAYAADNNGMLPFGPKAAAFGMGGNLYTSTGAPTSLICLQNGEPVGLGLIHPYVRDPKCFFCPGADQPLDAAAELARMGYRQVQSCYYYRHAGNTNITDFGSAAYGAPRLGALGDNRHGSPIRALVMDTQFLCSEGLRNFGAVPRTHHRRQFTNVLFADGSVHTVPNVNDRLTVDITSGANAHQSFELILQRFETADIGAFR